MEWVVCPQYTYLVHEVATRPPIPYTSLMLHPYTHEIDPTARREDGVPDRIPNGQPLPQSPTECEWRTGRDTLAGGPGADTPPLASAPRRWGAGVETPGFTGGCFAIIPPLPARGFHPSHPSGGGRGFPPGPFAPGCLPLG